MQYADEQEKKSIFMETLRFASLSIVYCKKYIEDSRWNTSHILNGNELFYVKSGCLHIAAESGQYIADQNKLFFSFANEYRSISIPKGTKAEFYIIRFDSEAGGTSYFNFVQSLPLIDAGDFAPRLDALFAQALKIGEPANHGQVFERIGCTGQILALLFQIAEADVKMPKRRSRINFSKVMAYIDRFYRYRKITIGELAALMNVSEGYFRREFKKEYGISCKMYIDSIRTEGALKMLRESDVPLKEIAENFHYSDAAYLSKIVKGRTGMNPLRYREKYR